MSTYWGYYCLDCKQETEKYFDEQLAKELLIIHSLLWHKYEKTYGYIGYFMSQNIQEWLEDHIDHEKVLIDVYGNDTEGNKLK